MSSQTFLKTAEHLYVPGNLCQVHVGKGYHRPIPLRTVKHHIWPQEFGGPTVSWNLILVCDTGHYNIHLMLEKLLKDEFPARTHGREREIAELGLDRIQRRAR